MARSRSGAASVIQVGVPSGWLVATSMTTPLGGATVAPAADRKRRSARGELRGPAAGRRGRERGNLVGGHVDGCVTAVAGADTGGDRRQARPSLERRLPHLPADHRATLQNGLLAD